MLIYEDVSPGSEARMVKVLTDDYKDDEDMDSEIATFGKAILEHENEHGDMRGSMLLGKAELIRYCKDKLVTFMGHKDLDVNFPFPVEDMAFSGTNSGSFVNLQRTGRGYSKVWIKCELNKQLVGDMKDDRSDIRRISDIPITRSFVFVDVSDFSQFSPINQLLVVSALASIVKRRYIWDYQASSHEARNDLEAELCIGDGYIYVLKSPFYATVFAAHLAGLIETMVAMKKIPEFHFRMGVDSGEVRCFFDTGRNDWNYIGDGINQAQRILSAIKKTTDDVLYISGEIRQQINADTNLNHISAQLLNSTIAKGRRMVKHGAMRRVFEVNYSSIFSSNRSTFNQIAKQMNPYSSKDAHTKKSHP